MSLTSDDTPKKQNKGRKVDRADPLRFVEPGINYKGKLIGIEDVPEPRGDKMCQVAMAKLKAAVKTLGDHKQKIIVNVSLQGVRIVDEKSELLVHFHPVHRISFISRDPNDSRAFGYVYGNASGSHQFYGIKTEKVAEGIVICLRDLFQVVFEMKKQSSENSRNCLAAEDQGNIFSEHKPSPKLGSNRTAWLKSEYWSQSVGMPPSGQYRGSVTPGSIKKETNATSKTCYSPVLFTSSANASSLKQNTFAGHISRTSMTPEPVYQNASVLSGKLTQSAVTSATPLLHVSATAESRGSSEGKVVARSGRLQKTRLSDGDREWVSFEFDDGEKSPFNNQSEGRKNVKKDPFANDPFFSRTAGGDEIGEVVVWTQDKAPETSEPTYGVFVRPENIKDFAGCMASHSKEDDADTSENCQENQKLCLNLSKFDPYQCFPKPSSLISDKRLSEQQSLEMPSDQESSSDLVSFPSPDAPPPPLPQNTLVLLDEKVPVLPPRPGLKQKQNVTGVCDHFTKPFPSFQDESHFDGLIPAMNEISLNDQTTDTSRDLSVVPEPPPRHNLNSELLAKDSAASGSDAQEPIYTSLIHRAGVHSAPLDCQKCPDPFTIASIKGDEDSQIVAAKRGSLESLGSFVSRVPESVGAVLPSAAAEWVNANQELECRGFSTNQHQIGELEDPFLHQDPFGLKGFPACQNSDPFGKRFPTDSQPFQTHVVTSDASSDAFDNVFSSRDELYEKVANNGHSPTTVGVVVNGEENGISPSNAPSLSCRLSDMNVCTTGSETLSDFQVLEIESRRNVANKDAESYAMEPKLEEQSSFDSVLNDFAQRFPPIDDGWMTFLPEGSRQFSHSLQNDQVIALPPENNKSRLSVPKSSDSSSNSEIAEAFSEDQSYFSGCKAKDRANV